MSWIIKDMDGYVFGVDPSEWSFITYDREAAKRFETKHDAADYMKQHSISGHIIPA